MNKWNFYTSKEIKPQKPSNEELRAAGYPMTYTTPAGDVWHRNLAAELGRSDDLDCDDPDAKIEPGDSYMSDDVYQFMKKANSNN